MDIWDNQLYKAGGTKAEWCDGEKFISRSSIVFEQTDTQEQVLEKIEFFMKIIVNEHAGRPFKYCFRIMKRTETSETLGCIIF